MPGIAGMPQQLQQATPCGQLACARRVRTHAPATGAATPYRAPCPAQASSAPAAASAAAASASAARGWLPHGHHMRGRMCHTASARQQAATTTNHDQPSATNHQPVHAIVPAEDVPGLSAFPGGEFSLDMQVRDYELDQFNVVNNACYASYFQHGRHEAFAALGYNVDWFAQRGTPLALSELRLWFKLPLRTRDKFRVTVYVKRVTVARATMHQRILAGTRSGQEVTIAEAEATVVFLDGNYKPTRIPQDVQKVFNQIVELHEEAERQRQQQQQQ